mgnify:CR=1 FL=1
MAPGEALQQVQVAGRTCQFGTLSDAARRDLVDRRRIELIEPDVVASPVHHVGGQHPMHQIGERPDDDQLRARGAVVRASVNRATAAPLASHAQGPAGPISSASGRA